MIRTLTTAALAERAASPRHAIVDVRPSAAYNGWTLRGEARGGHIPGARSLPLEWTEYLDFVEAFEDKQLDPTQPVTVYGYDGAEARAMAEKLERLGFRDIHVYDAFLAEWAGDPARPLERLERYRQLVPAAWLHALLEGEPVEHPPQREWVVCHAHFDNPADYARGHIPGALSLDTNTLESPETWNRRTPAELEATLLGLGIQRHTTVILYGRFSHPTYAQPQPGQSAGQLAAMRCALIMLYAGVEDVRVLDGGIHAWEQAGHPLSTEPHAPRPANEFGAEIPGRPEYVIDMPEARALLEAADGDLVAMTSWAEFIGEVSGYHYIEKKGRIPGAVFGDCGTDAYHMENTRNLDHTIREAGEVARRWAGAGITPDRRIAFYCGTGWRASEAFMNAYLMGWPRVAIYDGGWYEWSADPANPIGTGVPGESR
jgi:thiosulfate/3-mercaptopyruvate sulfurtransferase